MPDEILMAGLRERLGLTETDGTEAILAAVDRLANQPTAEAAPMPEGVALIESDQLAALQAAAAEVAAMRAERDAERRAGMVDAAVADGRITPARRDHWLAQLNAELAKVQRSFGGEPKLQLVSISIDPQHDTVDVLREYEKKLGANEETWHFLTGEEALIRELSRSGFKLGTGGGDVPGEDLFHSTKLTLVDSEGQIRGYYSSEDREAVEKLKSDASRLLSEITS